MVVESIRDYERYKEEVRNYYLNYIGVPEESVDYFMEYFSDHYDKYKRNYLPYRLQWYLFDKREWVIQKNQHFWMAFIGRTGGEGKTTLATHCLYFLDKTFNPDRRTFNYLHFIKELEKALKKTKYPAVLLDEPDAKIHHMSETGRQMKSIIEKIRQLNMFGAICTNDLNLIPSFIYNRLQLIFFINNKHRFWAFANDRDLSPKQNIIELIKKEYNKEKHALFTNSRILNRAFLKNQQFSAETPFREKKYLEKKREDLLLEMRDFLSGKTMKEKIKEKLMKEFEVKLNKQKYEFAKVINIISKEMGVKDCAVLLGKTPHYIKKWINFYRRYFLAFSEKGERESNKKIQFEGDGNIVKMEE